MTTTAENRTDALARNAEERFVGLLVGCAVGDSVGLPAEGLSKEHIQRRWKGVWKQRLLPGRGMISDDTEHTLMVAECLVRCHGDVNEFRRLLGWKMRSWFLAVPPGIGLATTRSCLKLCLGFSPKHSGVRSAGNGPAMRSAVIGAFFHNDVDRLREFVKASTEMTHTDPRALTGALATAVCAAWIVSNERCPAADFLGLLDRLEACGDDREWTTILQKLRTAFSERQSVEDFAVELGASRGVSGYVYQTVPVAIFGWMRHRNDFRSGLESVFNCGGDTDTVGAIAGSLLGLESGADQIPEEWVRGTVFWPMSKPGLTKLGRALASPDQLSPPRVRWWNQFGKNLCMLPVVLIHALVRIVR